MEYKYKYIYKNTPLELWQLSMYYVYGSIVGVCNIVFTLAMFILIIKKWDDFIPIMRIILVLLACWFPTIHPMLIYSKTKKQAAAINNFTEIAFSEKGVHAKLGRESSFIPWKKVVKVSKKPTMIIVFTDNRHGYILTKRILRDTKEEFYNFVSSKVEN